MKNKIRKCKLKCVYIFLAALICFLCFIAMFTEKFGKPLYFFASYPLQNKIIKINNYDDVSLWIEISSKFNFHNADSYLCYKNINNLKYFDNIKNVSISSNMISYYENIDFINNDNIS